MCLAVSGQVLSIDGEHAMCDLGGVMKRINVAFFPDIAIGEWVMIHTGFAISRVTADDADAAKSAMALIESARQSEKFFT